MSTLVEQVRAALVRKYFRAKDDSRTEMICKLVDSLENMCGILVDNNHCKACVEMANEALTDLRKELGILKGGG